MPMRGRSVVGQVLMNEASLVDSIAQQLEEAEGQRPAMQQAKQRNIKVQRHRNSRAEGEPAHSSTTA